MSKKKYYSCNMKFLIDKTVHDIFVDSYFSKVIVPLCYIKICDVSTHYVSYELAHFWLLKSAGDLVRNFDTQTFASSDASFTSFRMIPTRRG